MSKYILNWLLSNTEYGQHIRGILYDGRSCIKKLEQGYRERYVNPRCEFDQFMRHKDKISNIL